MKKDVPGDALAAEVLARPQRRRFTAEYKLRILKEADGCKEDGQIGQLLRREGLYSSHLSKWRTQRDEGALSNIQSKKRGRRSTGCSLILKAKYLKVVDTFRCSHQEFVVSVSHEITLLSPEVLNLKTPEDQKTC